MCPTNVLKSDNGNTNTNLECEIHNDLSPRKGIYMDEALSKTGFGIFNYVIIFVSGCILYAVAQEVSGILFVIPVSQCDLKMTTSDKGILGGASLLGIICSSHLWGFSADTKGRRAVIMPTLFVAFVMGVLSSFVQNFYLFATLRFLNGFFISGASATIYAYLGEFHSNAHRSRAIMCSTVILGTACILMPLFAWIVINQDWQIIIPFMDLTYKPWRLYLVVSSVPGFLGALALIFLPESPKFVLGQGDKLKALQILRKMNRWNNGKKSQLETFELHEEIESIENRQRILDNQKSRFPLLKSVWTQTAPLFKAPYLTSTLLICIIQFGIFASSSGFFMFFAEILNKMAIFTEHFADGRAMMCDIINAKTSNLSGNESDITCIDKLELTTLELGIILEVVFALGYVVIGLVINKVGKPFIIFFILAVTGLSGIGCMFTDLPDIQNYLYSSLMCCGIAISVVNAMAVEIYPTSLRAMAMCISLMFGRLGGVFGSNAVAMLLDNHCETVFYISGSSVIAMGILAFFIPNLKQNEPSLANIQHS